MSNSQSLVVEHLPLKGKHLIEASAGTGKTFNITRLYLRALIERRLKVQQILVVTFTKAATEELRGRIRQAISTARQEWPDQYIPSATPAQPEEDRFFPHLWQQVDAIEARLILDSALLDLDEASIFTIHSFCKRVLDDQAFSSQLPFELSLETDVFPQMLAICEDWYRQIQHDTNQFLPIAERWPTPEHFLQSFYGILNNQVAICAPPDEASILQSIADQRQHALLALQTHEACVLEVLVDKHKDRHSRAEELDQLKLWLQQSEPTAAPKAARDFWNGNRQRAKAVQARIGEIKAALEPAKALDSAIQALDKQRAQIQRAQIVYQALPLLRERLTELKSKAGILDFNDLVFSLAHALCQDNEGKLAQQLRHLWPVAMVDEFQDTDSDQYRIFASIYQHVDSTLFMIGDPKQAIYSFRGGDIFAYLSARDQADQQWVMNKNWRSAPSFISAYNRLFYGTELNQKEAVDVFRYGIEYQPVLNGNKVVDSDWQDHDFPAPMQWIYFKQQEGFLYQGSMKQSFKAEVARWCAQEVRRLLAPESQVRLKGQPVNSQDIAFLVRDKSEAEAVQEALREQGLASVYLSQRDNVLQSQEAEELERLLLGIQRAEQPRMMIAALSTRYMGFTLDQLHQLQQDEHFWDKWQQDLVTLRTEWRQHGLLSMMQKVLQQFYQPEAHRRERALTNSLQLIELLQQQSKELVLAESLLHWFQTIRQNQTKSEAYELRLESDANLIRIVTQHGSKGLEYPIVFIPFPSRAKDRKKAGDWGRFHAQDHEAITSLMMSEEELQSSRQEMLAEDIRLLYVAVTRAQYRCYLCGVDFAQVENSPLGATLGMSASDTLFDKLESLCATAPDNSMQLREISDTDVQEQFSEPSTTEQARTVLSVFRGRIDRDWWLSSFSALSHQVRHGGDFAKDRDNDQASSEAADQLRFTMTKGAGSGNLLHDLLEHTDFSQPQWLNTLAKFQLPDLENGGNNHATDAQKQGLITWMEEVVQTELLPVGLKLSELKHDHTQRELEFYFPMQGGKMKAFKRHMDHYRQKPIPLNGDKQLLGMMHGFIDLVFEHQGKYYVADYKSNFLGGSLSDYRVDQLKESIESNLYDLQYSIYSLALHRYLSFRMGEDYQFDQHFGGVFYLFLRGMKPGSGTGVYYDAMSEQRLNELDQLFSQGNEQ